MLPSFFTRHRIQWILLAACFVFAFRQTLAGLWNVWISGGDESFALAIPFVAGYIIWEKRRLLDAAAARPNYTALPLVALFLVFGLYGVLGSSPSAVRIMLPLVLLSVTLSCFGSRCFRLLALPLSLTVFMLPLPTFMEVHLGLPLRRMSTHFGVMLLRVLDVSVFVEGNVIDLGVTRLQVVEACSGLRYLMPLLALGVLFAYFFISGTAKRLTLVVATLPLSIIANGLRIAVTGFLAQNHGPEVAEGFFHAFSGWLFFVFALLLLMAAMLALRRWSRPRVRRAPSGEPAPSHRASASCWPAVIICSVLLLVVGFLSLRTSNLPSIRLKGGFADFPLQIDAWVGRTETLPPQVVALSGAEEALNAAFLSADGRSISLYIGYRGSPFLESENFFHSPDVCLPSLGWKTRSASHRRIDSIPVFGTIEVQQLWIEKMGQKQLVFYWFQTRTRVSADVNHNRLDLFLHALARDSTYDLFIRPMTPLFPGESPEAAEARLDRFVRSLSESMQRFLAQNTVLDADRNSQNP